MAEATAQQRAAMDAAVAEVRRQYRAAWPRVDKNTGGPFVSLEARAIRKAYLDLGELLERWANTYRRWAVAGKRDDDTAYDVARFMEFGRGDLADAIQRIAGEAYDRGLFAAVRYTVEETGKQLNPVNWSTGVKVAAGAAVVVLLVLLVARVARSGGAA